ncbi:hypothetical protein J2741_000406 [Methanolinea mesophila]|uniref:DUF7490 domain-containing protein n=1 Tax=Methanolinea mesophila TaxID=547055 RepID=UPI001AE327B5|nr:hypothetical protein [Methanolinea mesophila]MBP1927859.1 hypothetical protein [Methanolinea mesophila]
MNSRVMCAPCLCLLLLLLTAGAGCVSAPVSTGQDRYDLGNGQQVSVYFVGQNSDWTFSRGCTWTATYQVSNTGQVGTGPIQVNIELVNADSGAVRDSRTIFVGTLAPGQSQPVVAELDGECAEDYTVRAIPAPA